MNPLDEASPPVSLFSPRFAGHEQKERKGDGKEKACVGEPQIGAGAEPNYQSPRQSADDGDDDADNAQNSSNDHENLH